MGQGLDHGPSLVDSTSRDAEWLPRCTASRNCCPGRRKRASGSHSTRSRSGACQHLYGHHPGRGYTPKGGYQNGPMRVHSIFKANHSEHSPHHRLMAHGFSDKAPRDTEPVSQTHINEVASRPSASKNHPSDTSATVVNLVHWY